MALTTKITGRIRLVPSGKFPPGLLVQAITSDGGWLGSATTGDDGFFYINVPNQGDLPINFTFNIYRGEQLLSSVPGQPTQMMEIAISDQQYDSKVKDTTFSETTDYTLITGKVTLGRASMAAVPQNQDAIKINVKKVLFRNQELLCTTFIDDRGHYEIKVPHRMLFRTEGQMQAALPKIVVDISGPHNETITSSEPALLEGDKMQIDLKVDESLGQQFFRTEQQYLDQLIQSATGLNPEQFGEIDISSGSGELAMIISATGLAADKIVAAIGAGKMAGQTGIDRAHAYAVATAKGSDPNVWMQLAPVELTDIVREAVKQNLITESADPGHSEAAIAVRQRDIVLKEATDDNRDIASVLTTIIPNGDLVNEFIKISLDHTDEPVEKFWNEVKGRLGDSAKKQFQQGLQAMAVTGVQPEMSRAILNKPEGYDLRGLAMNWTPDNWRQKIVQVSQESGRTCIPVNIQNEYEDEETMRSVYAQRLFDLATDIYATSVIGNKLETGTLDAPHMENPAEAARFIREQADFDLRTNNIWDFDLAGNGYDDIVRADLMPVQNLLRVTGGKPEAVAGMLSAGIKSSADIADMSAEAFVAQFAEEQQLMTVHAAQQVYAKASYTNLILSGIKAHLNPADVSTAVLTDKKWIDWLNNPDPSTKPDLQTLFGSMDLCSCAECMSMYSPAAYFTDILNMVKNKLGSPSKPYQELIRRREDLLHIDLTCKNANTAIPYVDLVNEMLELLILKSLGVSTPFKSYQTSGTAQELAAYPEHTYKDGSGNYQSYTGYETVYNDTLRKGVYPDYLPFDLPLEESRTYLEHLGYKRDELMKQLLPVTVSNPLGVPGINDYNIAAESLGLSRNEADIITKNANPDVPAGAWRFYGFPDTASATWFNTLCNGESGQGLKTLLKRSSITYKELLQLLNTEFLNKKNGSGIRPLEIISTNAANPASCQLQELKLKCNIASPEDIFKNWYRFLRLQKATGWSIYQLDIICTSLSITAINTTDFTRVATVAQICKQFNTAPEQLCAYWNNISTIKYINYNGENQDELPSVYDSLFRNKALINPPETFFDNPSAIVGTYKERAGTIVAAFNIKEEELFQMLKFLGIDVNAVIPPAIDIKALSRVYGMTQLAKGLGISSAALLSYFGLHQVNGPSYLIASVTTLFTNLSTVIPMIQAYQAMPFTLAETEYLLAHKDVQGVYIPADEQVQLFYETLRTELKKLIGNVSSIAPGSDLEKTLQNVVVQHFSTQFSSDSATALYLLSDVIKVNGTIPLMDALILPEFINALQPTVPDPFHPLPILPGNSIPSFAFSELFNAYRKLHKITMISNRYKLNSEELIWFHIHAAAVEVLDISVLPITAGASTLLLLQQLRQLGDWIKVKGTLNLKSAELIALLDLATGTGTKAAFTTLLSQLTGWTTTDLVFLLGDVATTGILNTVYSALIPGNDFRKGALLLQVSGIMNAVERIGLTPAITHKALRTDLVMADSRNIRKAAKAKHQEAEWLKIAKPLQDTLREKQRKALVGYIVARPDLIAGNNMKWNNENELFAYLLIDVEMQPCMKTSRIKQGISSIQLYMDRVILNLENINGAPSNHITISPAMTDQWKQWRKWYRIWEANRKIFLYPENWIEPELRDDKTPFFKELETQLLQDEVKDNTAEDAFRTYLERVEEVGRLEPVSAYHQIEKNSNGDVILDRTHVFGKTSSLPHRYFYRFLEDNEWSPWEKVSVDIKSDHVAPVIWNRKLYLFWLTFQKKKPSEEEIGLRRKEYIFTAGMEWTEALRERGRTGGTGSVITDPQYDGYNQWDITLNWSQFKDGKWLASELSKDTMNIDISKAILSNIALSSYSDYNKSKQAIDWLTNRGEIKMDELFKNRLYLYPTFENTNLNDVNHEDAGINFSVMFSPGLDETATGIHSFFWRGDNSQDPTVVRDSERGYQILAPTGTRFNRMKFVEDPSQNGQLRRDNTSYSPSTTTGNQYYTFSLGSTISNPGIVRNSSNVILNTTSNNGTYKVTARASINGDPHYHFHNPMLSEFLFEDKKNTFFVRWEPTSQLMVATDRVFSLDRIDHGTVAEYAGAYYPANLVAEINLPVNSFSGTTFATLYQPYAYRFHTFYHAQIHSFIKALNKDGIPGLLRIDQQRQDDTMNFGPYMSGNYQPTDLVHNNYPRNNVQFDFSDAYSIYNWEIFFHAPMMIAQRLSDNQQFEEAQKWYHYIFNPTSNTDINNAYTGSIKRFWKFWPFYNESQQPIETLYDLLMAINAGNAEAVAQVAKWEKNPFKPHVIARMRILAYMKNVLMKYIDNLVAWGDQLFRRDTIESINEATQLYILAANLLGERPQEIPPRAKTVPKTFNELSVSGFDALSNALVNIESFFAPNTATPTSYTGSGAPIYGKMFYFCLPKNDKLMGYWDTIADRLFKIRNCMNIEGTVRQLPLFEPPIDPALLVRAAAMGVDVNSILDSVSAGNLPQYRFSHLVQKANEFCGDVRGLGSSLLTALEKKDAEQLALIRSGQELQLLEKVKFIKEAQVTEAETALDTARLNKENTQKRFNYYSTRAFMNSGEQKQMQSLQSGMVMQTVQGALQTTASVLSIFPQLHIQAPFSLGPSFGGQQIAAALNAISSGIGIAASINASKGNMAGILGGYERRRDDWNFQADTAAKELEQMDKQILSAEIRLDIAKKELANHELQIENTTETDTFMRGKFSNAELYSWMSNQIATTYFQSYQLAYDLAKKAEECYNHELPLAKKPVGGFIKFGYWDSLRKGLMSGEKLQFDLRKMEATYMEENKREFELTKNFSLAMTNPQALLDLRLNGTCDFDLDQTWYDLDFPGHYMRKIKSVSISIPCVAGPYTTIASRLLLNSSLIQKTAGSASMSPVMAATEAIATSTAQNDAGVFELNFRDERYVPFENAGAVSSWTLSMMDDKKLRQFDYGTISDIIIHVKYTARNDDAKAIATKATLNSKLSTISTGINLPRYFSLKHEFSNEWYLGFDTLVNVSGVGNVGRPMNLQLKRDHFPEYSRDKTISISGTDFVIRPKADVTYKLVYGSTTIDLNGNLNDYVATPLTMTPAEYNKSFNFILYKVVGGIAQAVIETELEDLFFILQYKLG